MKNKGYAKFGGGGQIRCIMGNVEVAYTYSSGDSVSLSDHARSTHDVNFDKIIYSLR